MDGHWFKPKSFGYGATPANWKGWAATLGLVVAMALWSIYVFGVTRRSGVSWTDWSAWAAGVAVLSVSFIALARYKTDGAWTWRGFGK
jgi:hypothetical protein